MVNGERGVAFFAGEEGVEGAAQERVIGGEKWMSSRLRASVRSKVAIMPAGSSPGRLSIVPVLGLEEVAAIPEVFDAYVDVFHQVGGEGFEGGVGVGGLNLRFEFFA